MKRSSPAKSDAIYSTLCRRIRDGVWTQGDNITPEVELAKQLGCSRSTLSKAINRLAYEGVVERRTRAGTRLLRNSPSRDGGKGVALDAFAFIYPSHQHDGVRGIIQGFQEAAHAVGRRVVMLSAGNDFEREAEFIRRLAEFDVRGAVIYPVCSDVRQQIELTRSLAKVDMPLVFTELNLPGLGMPAVVVDGFDAGFTMTRHMIGRGAKRIGFFSNYAWASFMRDRYLGYRRALQEAGLAEPTGGVLLEQAMDPDFDDPVGKTLDLATTYLRHAGELDAVVCADDFLALACIKAAESLKLRCPQKLKISGIDGYTPLAERLGVDLTTYSIPFPEMGKKAFELLSAAVGGSSSSAWEHFISGSIRVGKSA